MSAKLLKIIWSNIDTVELDYILHCTTIGCSEFKSVNFRRVVFVLQEGKVKIHSGENKSHDILPQPYTFRGLDRLLDSIGTSIRSIKVWGTSVELLPFLKVFSRHFSSSCQFELDLQGDYYNPILSEYISRFQFVIFSFQGDRNVDLFGMVRLNCKILSIVNKNLFRNHQSMTFTYSNMFVNTISSLRYVTKLNLHHSENLNFLQLQKLIWALNKLEYLETLTLMTINCIGESTNSIQNSLPIRNLKEFEISFICVEDVPFQFLSALFSFRSNRLTISIKTSISSFEPMNVFHFLNNFNFKNLSIRGSYSNVTIDLCKLTSKISYLEVSGFYVLGYPLNVHKITNLRKNATNIDNFKRQSYSRSPKRMKRPRGVSLS